MFLILRCRPSDTLNQVANIRNSAVGLELDDVRCPTIRIERRVGRERARVEQDVPLLGNFIFVRWDDGNLYFANYLENKFPFVKIMRLPHGGYATCTEKEIYAIDHFLPQVDPSAPPPAFKRGDIVQVRRGTFLADIEGEVLDCKKNGEVKLKVLKCGELQLTTLLIHGSLLTVTVNA